MNMKKWTYRNEWKFVPLEKRLEKYTMPEPNTGCWIWFGPVNSKGYGALCLTLPNSKITTLLAHRAYYELHKSKIPAGMCVCHRCDNPFCVNPDHLFLGTRANNNSDRDKKGRVQRGSNHVRAKLEDVHVQIIREAVSMGHSQNLISKYFGMSSVWPIINNKSWKHI